MIRRIQQFACMVCLSAASALAAHGQPYLPASYDASIPTLEEAIGHPSGEEITTPSEILDYLAALQQAASDRMQIVEYARSWQGRPLVYAVIASPEQFARLDAIKADLARLGSGEALSTAERDAIVARTPAVVWLAYGVHGDEITSPDAALALAHHLLAAESDETVDVILENTIVIIDPLQNPDGRARFVNSFESDRGLEPQADRYAAEHDQPWPRGRFNHYLFDMNRDWFTLSQPETRGRVAAMQDWHPVVVVDAHEMGGDETYFFAPAAEPFNPYITAEQRAKQDIIGRNHARWFDRFGIEYFTREVYDAFYPGYGDMWPTLNGAIAMTYEQGSPRGLVFERNTGEQLSYRDGVQAHFLATLSTAEVVARNHALFLNDYTAVRQSAVREGSAADDRYYVVDLATNRWQAERTARDLVFQGIDAYEVSGPSDICGRSYPEGALVVDTAQPSGRLARTLLSPDTPLDADFVAEQDARRARGLDWEIYDVTAWSLPLMAGLDAQACRRVDLGEARPVLADAPISGVAPDGSATFGFAVPWSDAGQAKLVLTALREGLIGKSTDEAFTVDGRTYPRGSVVFSASANDDELGVVLRRLATEIGAELVPLETGWTEAGPNLGSASFHLLRAPRVALAWGEGTYPTDTGAARYVLEREFGVPVAPIRLRSLSRADLSRYDVLILPDGDGYADHNLSDSISDFARRGGVVIGFADAVPYLASDDVGLLSTRQESAWVDPDHAPDDASDENDRAPGTRLQSPDDYKTAIAASETLPDRVPGVLLNAEVDTDHWLSAGYDAVVALFRGREIFTPLDADAGTNVVRFVGADDALASGHLWDEIAAQVAYKPFVMIEPTGDGFVIGFTESPVTRAYLDGLNLLLLNAVLLGPAHTD